MCIRDRVKGYAGGFRGVLGHEFAGVVEAVGSSVAAEWVGPVSYTHLTPPTGDLV